MTPRVVSFLLLACLLSPLHASTVQFAARQDIQTTAQHLTGLAVADFNGDGFLDIAVTDDYANQITVYLNDKHGGFSQPIVTNLAPGGYGGLGNLVSGDVNEDGKQDLIVAPIAGTQYDIVLLGNGDGTFTPGQVLKSTYGFLNAQLIDINGDKHLDLVSGGNPNISIELGDGKGNFTDSSIPSTETPNSFNTGLAIADFNGDGHLDLLVSAYSTRELQLFLGNGDGTFGMPTTSAPPILSTSGASLIAADFKGDGKQDFLLSEDYIALVVLGNGDGTFQLGDNQLIYPNVPYVPLSAVGASAAVAPVAAVGDMDGSGTPDIVVADDNASLLSVLLNDGTGTFKQTTPDYTSPVDPGSGQIRLADLNGDGLPDIVITNYKTQKISVFLSVIPKTTPSIALSSSASQVLIGGTPTVTVQVKPSASHVPTGTVTLASGSTSFGQQTLNATGQATFALSNLATGQYNLTATYGGDTYNSGTSNATSFNEAITDFQVALSANTQSVAVIATATYSLILTPVAGYIGTVAITCSGLPAAYTCAPVTATMTGQVLTVPFVLSPTSTMALLRPASSDSQRSQGTLAFIGIAGLSLCFSRRRRLGMLAITLISYSALTLSGCSGAASSPPPYTGTSNFTITATATQGAITVSHPIHATLTVHQ